MEIVLFRFISEEIEVFGDLEICLYGLCTVEIGFKFRFLEVVKCYFLYFIIRDIIYS